MEEVHIPGQTEKEFEEAPAPETPAAPASEEAPTGDTPPADAPPGDAPAPDAPAPTEGEDPAPEPPAPIKKRSIYDDLKDTRKEKNAFRDAAVAALEAQGVTLTGNETADELQALAKKTPSPTADAPAPDAPAAKPATELEAYAKENSLDPAALSRLVDIISKQIPKADLTQEERQQLADLKTWKEGKEREDARAAEDRDVLAQAPTVRDQLKQLGHEIHDEAEAKKVMDEIVRLAHTAKYHDKEVSYIVWAEREKLAKMISPKKPSFERADGSAPDAEPTETVFNGKMTPAAAQKAVENGYAKSNLEIRRGS